MLFPGIGIGSKSVKLLQEWQTRKAESVFMNGLILRALQGLKQIGIHRGKLEIWMDHFSRLSLGRAQ